MWKIFSILLCILMTNVAKAQDNNVYEANADLVSSTLARKMTDSLQLSTQQYNELVKINRQLHDKKHALILSGLHRDSVSLLIQKVENSRDSLYQLVITKQQFDWYKGKKKRLIKND